MAQLYKIHEIIFSLSAKNIIVVILLTLILEPAFGVVGKVTDITKELATEETRGTKHSNRTAEIPPSAFDHFIGIKKPVSPVIIKLDSNKMDLSPVIQILEQVKKSHHDNYFKIRIIENDILSAAEHLCNTLSEKNRNMCREDAYETFFTFLDNIKKERSERILYPRWYSNAKYNIESYFPEAVSLLDSDCRSNCSHYTVIQEILFSSKTQYSQLYDRIKRKNKNCQNAIISGLAKNLTKIRLPKKCLQKENKNHPVCKDILKYLNATARERFSALAELAYGEEVLKTTEAKAPCFDCAIKSDEKSNELFDFVNTLEEQSQCFDLKTGEEKIVHSGTGLSESYTVQKEPDGSYSVALNLQFLPDEDYDGEISKDHVPQHYMEKAQKCMKQANKGMLGPNEEKLRIVIKDTPKNDTCSVADTKKIFIGSEDHRSNSGKYESDIDCPTITHEILHLLGLCDEYKEASSGFYVNSKTGDIRPSRFLDKDEKKKLREDRDYEFKLAFDCRVTQDDNNIMSSQSLRWMYVFGIDGDKETDHSLLFPGQFNSILYGGCSRKNKIFNECSQLAYQSSVDNPNCMEQKKQCESQNVHGLDKQKKIEEIKRRMASLDFDKRFFEKEIKEGNKKFQGTLDYINERINSLKARFKNSGILAKFLNLFFYHIFGSIIYEF